MWPREGDTVLDTRMRVWHVEEAGPVKVTLFRIVGGGAREQVRTVETRKLEHVEADLWQETKP